MTNFHLKNRQIKKPEKPLALWEQFNNNYSEFVKANPLWIGELIPLHPIDRNYRKISAIKYNINKLKKDLWTASNNNEWINKDAETSKWNSITLKSFTGGSQSFLIETELGIGEENRYKYTKAIEGCDYFKEILDNIPTDVYLVRILKLDAGGLIKFHTDNVVFKKTKDIIRCHIPIITNKNVKFRLGYPQMKPAPGLGIWKADVLHEKYLEAGYMWYTNVNALHGVINNSNEDRYHLVIDMRPPFPM